MTTSATVDPQPGDAPSRWLVWFGVLGAPAAWLVHLAGAVALVPVACETGSEIGIHILTAVTAVVAAAAVVVALRGRWADDDAGPSVAFLARVGVWLGALFLALIVLEGSPVLALGACR